MPRKYTPEERAQAFWARVDQSGGHDACWPWTGSLDRKGYGRPYAKDWPRRTHRVAWMLTNGPIPEGMSICHHCDNPPCCNPAHLFCGSNLDNIADRVAKGRSATGDRSGARVHPERLARGERNGTHTRPDRVARGPRHVWHTKPEKRPRGERNGFSRLTEIQVVEIRMLYATGEWTPRMLALRFRVSRSTIRRVIIRECWTHIFP